MISYFYSAVILHFEFVLVNCSKSYLFFFSFKVCKSNQIKTVNSRMQLQCRKTHLIKTIDTHECCCMSVCYFWGCCLVCLHLFKNGQKFIYNNNGWNNIFIHECKWNINLIEWTEQNVIFLLKKKLLFTRRIFSAFPHINYYRVVDKLNFVF